METEGTYESSDARETGRGAGNAVPRPAAFTAHPGAPATGPAPDSAGHASAAPDSAGHESAGHKAAQPAGARPE
ncbi:hypothetical protein J7E93_16230, partial [Streptomyces sp. ISL-36]|nr:hypothetical protein [Streptomyces sp. ISL-36]